MDITLEELRGLVLEAQRRNTDARQRELIRVLTRAVRVLLESELARRESEATTRIFTRPVRPLGDPFHSSSYMERPGGLLPHGP